MPIKYIAEPEMHSMPATTLHPTGGFFVGQSLDNKIVTWTARDKFRQMKKKEFKGHVNAGYACRMAFSPNGKFLASGDGQGKMYIWDWGSTKVYRKLQVRGKCSLWYGRVIQGFFLGRAWFLLVWFELRLVLVLGLGLGIGFGFGFGFGLVFGLDWFVFGWVQVRFAFGFWVV